MNVPKALITSNVLPMAFDAKRVGIEIVRMSNVGHFCMLEKPHRFNRLLEKAVKKCIGG
jgi:pimeloyl-ACP methyl ester carboxylesterase